MANNLKYNNTIINVGDLVRVHHKIKEDDKDRIQIFEGIVISIRGEDINKSITVRRIAANDIGVERIWPILSPNISKIEIRKKGKGRRAKLYYLRNRLGKAANKVKIESEETEKKQDLKTKDEKKKPGKSGRKSSPKVSSK